jgi:hypothetical protein
VHEIIISFDSSTLTYDVGRRKRKEKRWRSLLMMIGPIPTLFRLSDSGISGSRVDVHGAVGKKTGLIFYIDPKYG